MIFRLTMLCGLLVYWFVWYVWLCGREGRSLEPPRRRGLKRIVHLGQPI